MRRLADVTTHVTHNNLARKSNLALVDLVGASLVFYRYLKRVICTSVAANR
jgi:RNA-binding protein YhbY